MSIPGPWKQICKISDYFDDFGFDIRSTFHVVPGTNSDLLFWHDSWVFGEPLCSRFPNLYQLEAVKLSLLRDRVCFDNGSQLLHFHWIRQLTEFEHADVLILIDLIKSVAWAGISDVWSNDNFVTGRFLVKNIRSRIRELQEIQLENRFVWIKWIPIKVNFLAWRLWLNRLPTKDNLIRRNVNIPSMMCEVCGMENESLEHVFGSCVIAAQVWEFVSQWCRITPFFFFSVSDLPTLALQLRGDVGWKHVAHLIIITSIWCLWRNRNDAIFNSKKGLVSSIIEEIRLLSFTWIKNRSTYKALTWENWSDFNFHAFQIV